MLRCWLEANENTDTEILICPEMGSLESGYNLSTLPNGWEDAKMLRVEIDQLWNRLV